MRIYYKKKYFLKKKYKNFNTLVNVANFKFYKEFKKKNEIIILHHNILNDMVLSLIPKFN